MVHDTETSLDIERTSELDNLPLHAVILAVKREKIGTIVETLKRSRRRHLVIYSRVCR